MLVESGDLIPVKRAAADIPWTKRKSQFLNYIHRGPVDFSTYVYDTNVGDIAPLSTYFNPYHWTIQDLNCKFGMKPDSNSDREMSSKASSISTMTSSDSDDAKSRSLQPKLYIYPVQESPSGAGNGSCQMMPFKDCACCSGNELSFGSIFRPKPVRANVQVRQNPPGSPESPDRELTLPIRMDDSDTIFRATSGGGLEPIGPPKRRKVAAPSPNPETDSSWPNFPTLKTGSDNSGSLDIRNSYFSILSESSPWSPWGSQTFGFGAKKDQKQDSDDGKVEDDLACGLRQIVQQSNTFFSASTLP